MNSTCDVLIVGAGIVGAACAAECARAGLKVRVMERGPIGGGTTAAGMGHVVVMDDSEAQFALTAWSRTLWQERISELPGAVEFDPCGTLWVAADELEMEAVRAKQRFYTDRGVRAEILDADALRRAEPNIRPGLLGALRIPDDAVIYPPAAARGLIDEARQHHAEVRAGTTVQALLPEGGVVLADGSRIPAGVVVNAAGPWSPALTPDLAVRKRKGHLVITDRYPGFVRHQLVELGYLKSAHSATTSSVAFNIQPRRTGQMLIGSSREFAAEGSEINSAILDRMLRRAGEFLPGLGRLSVIRCWTGHRAATPDKLPLIGPSGEHDRLWLATGHEGLGITTSLGTARLLVDRLLGRPSAIAAEPYLPTRAAKAEGGSHG